MFRRFQHIIPWAVFILLLAFQIPFLEADPDLNLSGSRGAFTDEGLYSAQVRNLLQQGDLTFTQAPSALITPLFSLFLYLVFSVFGINLWLGRLAVLLLSLLLLRWGAVQSKQTGPFASFFLLFAGTGYVLFSYTHFCLAEMLATSCIFVSIGLQVANIEKKPAIETVASHAILFAAFLLKLQFLYILPLLPMLLFMQFFLVTKAERKAVFRQLLIGLATLFTLSFFYFLVWYLPNKALFIHVMSDATTGRFVDFHHAMPHIKFIINTLFLNNYQWFNSLGFAFLLPFGLWLLINKDTALSTKLLLIGGLCWVLLESHKLLLNYYPTRYFVSFYLAILFSNALILSTLWQLKLKTNWHRILIGIFLLGCLLKNGKDYLSGWQNRAYSLKAVNKYMAAYNFGQEPVMGAWAPSFCWKNKAKTYPVWGNYFNDDAVFEHFRPAIIISETGEEDSNQAFASKGIKLDEQADSIRYFTVGRWKLKVIWVKK